MTATAATTAPKTPRDYADLLSPLLSPTDRELLQGLDLFEEHTALALESAAPAGLRVEAKRR